jgi:hypothetical protein
MALWAPSDPAGPTVLVNVDSPILQEIVEYHRAQYLDVYAEEVRKTTIRSLARWQLVGLLTLKSWRKNVPEQELDRDYRSE